MAFKCPGSAGITQPKPEEIQCTRCKAEVEIWSDEAKARCPECKNRVWRREELTSCLDWCPAAEECAGEEAYKKYLREKKAKAA